MFKRRPGKAPMSREQALAMKPIQLVDVELDLDPAGNGKLLVKVQPTRIARWFTNRENGRKKTFELDPVGVYVWKQIDGKTSVEALIRRIAKQYNLDLRQAEASTTAFLKTLMQKGLIGIPMKDESEGR